ncbi:uncharacterized protein [Clytia hemisphaerica]|uniref:Uncharacterized protein n=1 Tax=Clytia hemisphaerica TaxID=252671 RepID=A0A7M6DPL9_9CNID
MGMLSLLCFTSLIIYGHSATTEQKVNYLTNHVKALTRQVMLQQFFDESRVRTEGQSGLNLIRQRQHGLKNYFSESHSGWSSAAIHDHANNDRTVGMGEFAAVLNGVEFKTRHNDYRLYMPHRTSKNLNAWEPVPFPDVPPEVLNIADVDEQVAEMREWFKAFQKQDYSVRDYRKYFKPVLCYLEGGWSQSGKDIDEPFESDRHFVDAASWQELHEKMRYVGYSGGKSRNENLSFLPTKIINLINDTVPSFAQWNYRIMCHPLGKDIPLKRLRIKEDLAARMMANRDIQSSSTSRGARFELNHKNEDRFYERPTNWRNFLDELMGEIPGKDNYQAKLVDEGLEYPAQNLDGTTLNAGYYHRWFTVGKDAMGSANQHRGFSDPYLFTAMNTQAKSAGVDYKKCMGNPKKCHMLKQRWSYAIPLEIIYLTPLYKWNPFKLNHFGNDHWTNRKILTEGGKRNGDCKGGAAKAFNGINSRFFYQTPAAFYSGASVNSGGAADTARGVTCVLDQDGKVQQVRAAGTHIFLPQIKDVGILRTRFPIFPVHGEGSSVWKELNALREVTMNEEIWKRMYWKNADLDSSKYKELELEMGYSESTKTSRHTHYVTFTPEEVLQLRGYVPLTKMTTQANGHSHQVRIRYLWWIKKYDVQYCDGFPNTGSKRCWDTHDRFMAVVTQ